MSTQNFIISDTHFGHTNIIRFKDNDGNLIRPFDSVDQMDDFMVEKWNSVVRDVDRVYHLGDVAMNRRCLRTLERLKGRKILLRGNHDIFKLKDYIPYFEDIRGYKIFPKSGVILSHFPIHPRQFDLGDRWKLNVHGHLHQNVIDDNRYYNVSVERINYTPVNYDDIIKKFNLQNKGQYVRDVKVRDTAKRVS